MTGCKKSSKYIVPKQLASNCLFRIHFALFLSKRREPPFMAFTPLFFWPPPVEPPLNSYWRPRSTLSSSLSNSLHVQFDTITVTAFTGCFKVTFKIVASGCRCSLEFLQLAFRFGGIFGSAFHFHIFSSESIFVPFTCLGNL